MKPDEQVNLMTETLSDEDAANPEMSLYDLRLKEIEESKETKEVKMHELEKTRLESEIKLLVKSKRESESAT